MRARKPISVLTPPDIVAGDLRENWIRGMIGLRGKDPRKAVEMVDKLKASGIDVDLPAAHVFDLGFLLDDTHASFIGQPLANELVTAPERLLAPFPQTLLIHRVSNGIVLAYLVVEREIRLTITVFSYHDLAPEQTAWGWAGTIELERDRLENKTHRFGTLGFEQASPEQTKSEVMTHINLTVIGLTLLTQKADVVVVEPALSVWTDMAYAFRKHQRRNPSVSIVRVNTERRLMIERPVPTGATVCGHDRRQHVRRVGNRLIAVKACQVKGGAERPTAKVIQLAKEYAA